MKLWIWVVVGMLMVAIGMAGPGRPVAVEAAVPMVGTPTPVSSPACLSAERPGWNHWMTTENSKRVWGLHQDGTRLWVGTDVGGRRLDLATGKVETFLPEMQVRRFVPWDGEQLWVLTDRGVQFFDGSGWRLIQFSQGRDALVTYANPLGIGIDSQGQLIISFPSGRHYWWFGVPAEVPPADGSWVFEGVKGPDSSEFYNLNYDCSAWPKMSVSAVDYSSEEECRAQYEAKADLSKLGIYPGNVAVGPQGVWWVREKRLGLWAEGKNQEWKLSVNFVTALEIDSGGGVWLGTDQGLASFNVQTGKLRWVDLGTPTCVLPVAAVQSVAMDGSGQVWAATGYGLFKLNGRTQQWQRYTGLGRDSSTTISSMAVGKDGTLWAAGLKSLWRINARGAKSISYPVAECKPDFNVLTVDVQGKVWGRSQLCGVWEYQPASGKWRQHFKDQPIYNRGLTAAEEGVYAMAEGRLWLYQSESWSDLGALPSESADLAANPDPAGGVWLFEWGQGRLWHYQNGQFTPLEVDRGGEVGGLAVDPAGGLWVGVRDGVMRYADGVWSALPVVPSRRGMAYHLSLTRDGRLWVYQNGELWAFNGGK